MSKFSVALVFEDGRSEHIRVDEDDTIYLACLRNKIRILTDCLEGACATCKAHCVEGDYDLDDVSEEALSEQELEKRLVLTCQMHPRSDCVIEFPYDSKLAIKQEPKNWACKVISVEKVSSTVMRLDLEINRNQDDYLAFLPGQYVNLSVPGTNALRSYSFATSPHDLEKVSFFIKVIENGSMSSYVSNRAKVGDIITMTGPFGHFYLREPVRPIVMVAGGTGLAPMLSMFDHMIEVGTTSFPIRLLIGANEPSDLFYLDRIENYISAGLSLKSEVAVVKGNSNWSGKVGHITNFLRDELIQEEADIYLCGPPPMIEASERWLVEKGIDKKFVHSEKFVPSKV
ncbi:MAG: NADH oxidase [Rhodospirillaceae bacterium]|nr:NADH oxidase [Rhodospirillaceae bacterium]